MAARPTVPKFGNWDNEQEPYTVYFDQARKYKGGKAINPNDPEMYQSAAPSKPRTLPPEEPVRRGGVRQTNERREDGGFQQFSNHLARNNGNMSSRGRGSNSGGRRRQSGGSDHSFEKSPLHPQHRAKLAPGRSSPSHDNSFDTPGRSYDSSHGGIGKSRLKPESPDRAAIPKFGGWDDVNPQSAENYTEIFNRVREAKRLDNSTDIPGTPSRSSYNTQKQEKRAQKCCFPWW
ncbi:PREDICTED: RPM1-interacting protein 4-like isoform X1 [Ipomoea nil]|uniref:RPM1-interacting protein 4-like isoform X1 n=1 Tax=Ipomoea nil TaxID=35883 RepID=UPI000901397C|nr:PREDICTED: RPM1-interacting protein 4-like isoform X1 [Ipomoea nil]XP_019166506.1 PREDICTED: RPM1-interacting protein 4-like isoform X1 [Ipomoea nil]